MDFNYREYSLNKLEEWMHDAMSAGKATPQEIYDVIKGVVEENYYCYKEQTAKAYELLALLNGNGKGHIKAYDDCVDKVLSCDEEAYDAIMREKEYYEPSMPPWGHSDMEYMVHNSQDKVVKWQLPVEVDGLTGDCYVNLPDDLLERAGLVEGDVVKWIDRGDGSFEMRKVNDVK